MKEKTDIYKPRKEASEYETNPAVSFILDFQPLELRGNNFFCLSYLICGTLLWQLS